MALVAALQTAQAGCQPLRCRPAQASRSSRLVLTCRAAQSSHKQAESLQLAVAGIAAAALLHAGAADAGVILEKPATKKVFQPEVVKKVQQAADSAAEKSSEGGFKAPSLKAPSLDLGGGIDTNFLVLPGAILALGGGYFALSKLDAGWSDFFSANVVKDSTTYAGYEQEIKSAVAANAKKASNATKKVKTQAKKATKTAKKGLSLPKGLKF